MQPSADFAAVRGVLFTLAVANAAHVLPAGDITETPFPIAPNTWFLQVDTVRWEVRDGAAGSRVETTGYGEFLLGYGLTATSELQLTAIPWQRVEEHSASTSARLAGAGDLTVRLNHNVHRAPHDRFGVSLLPYVTLPTGSRDLAHAHVSGGLVVPVAWAWSDRTMISAMVDTAVDRNDADDAYRLFVSTSVSFDTQLTDNWATHAEVVIAAPAWNPNTWAVSGGGGIGLGLGSNAVAMIGVNVGLTTPAHDWEGFFRFIWTW